MGEKLRAVHYINQFFAQVGGEEAASSGITVKEGPVGPGIKINQLLGDRGEIVATIICGDNYIAENLEAVTEEIFGIIKSYEPDLFFAGPAFNAGRYGVACGSVAAKVKTVLDIPSVTAMFEENPGVSLFAPTLCILKSEDNARHMPAKLTEMVDFAFKIYEGRLEYDPVKENFHERGWIKPVWLDTLASERAVDMLLKKYRGEPVKTEILQPVSDNVEKPAPLKSLKDKTIVLISDGGLYPADNPDKMPSASSTTFKAYPLVGKSTLEGKDYTVLHNGYDTSFAKEDPNRLIPLDAMRIIASEGECKLHEYFLSTTGLTTNVINSTKIGKGMVEYIRQNGIDAAILSST